MKRMTILALLCFLMMLSPCLLTDSQAAAKPEQGLTLEFNPNKAKPGDEITISITGGVGGKIAQIYLIWPTVASVMKVKLDAQGNWSTKVNVPANTPPVVLPFTVLSYDANNKPIQGTGDSIEITK